MDARLSRETHQAPGPLVIVRRRGGDHEHRVVERGEQRVERRLGLVAQTIDHFPVRVLPVTLPSSASFSRWACTV